VEPSKGTTETTSRVRAFIHALWIEFTPDVVRNPPSWTEWPRKKLSSVVWYVLRMFLVLSWTAIFIGGAITIVYVGFRVAEGSTSRFERCLLYGKHRHSFQLSNAYQAIRSERGDRYFHPYRGKGLVAPLFNTTVESVNLEFRIRIPHTGDSSRRGILSPQLSAPLISAVATCHKTRYYTALTGLAWIVTALVLYVYTSVYCLPWRCRAKCRRVYRSYRVLRTPPTNETVKVVQGALRYLNGTPYIEAVLNGVIYRVQASLPEINAIKASQICGVISGGVPNQRRPRVANEIRVPGSDIYQCRASSWPKGLFVLHASNGANLNGCAYGIGSIVTTVVNGVRGTYLMTAYHVMAELAKEADLKEDDIYVRTRHSNCHRDFKLIRGKIVLFSKTHHSDVVLMEISPADGAMWGVKSLKLDNQPSLGQGVTVYSISPDPHGMGMVWQRSSGMTGKPIGNARAFHTASTPVSGGASGSPLIRTGTPQTVLGIHTTGDEARKVNYFTIVDVLLGVVRFNDLRGIFNETPTKRDIYTPLELRTPELNPDGEMRYEVDQEDDLDRANLRAFETTPGQYYSFTFEGTTYLGDKHAGVTAMTGQTGFDEQDDFTTEDMVRDFEADQAYGIYDPQDEFGWEDEMPMFDEGEGGLRTGEVMNELSDEKKTALAQNFQQATPAGCVALVPIPEEKKKLPKPKPLPQPTVTSKPLPKKEKPTPVLASPTEVESKASVSRKRKRRRRRRKKATPSSSPQPSASPPEPPKTNLTPSAPKPQGESKGRNPRNGPRKGLPASSSRPTTSRTTTRGSPPPHPGSLNPAAEVRPEHRSHNPQWSRTTMTDPTSTPRPSRGPIGKRQPDYSSLHEEKRG
jgi:hypothetical protein